jgi:DNA polymerase-3 subunit delta'
LIRLRKIANNEEILTTKDYSTEEIANYKNIVKNFIKTYEQKKIEVLAYSQKLWFKEFNDKEKMELGLQIMLYYYLKILDYKHNTSTEDESFIKEIAEKLEMSEICDKILVIDLFKQKIKNNLNLNLLFDNLIITLEKG